MTLHYITSKVKQYALQWTYYVNIHYEWVTTGDSDIRVSFAQREGCWCMVGKDFRSAPQDKPTMNLDLSAESCEDAFSRKVLREFGRTLGYIYGQSAHIPRNQEAVHGQNEDNCESQDEVNSNASFDLSSIVLYPMPVSLTDGVTSHGCNHPWLVCDNSLISKSYPRDSNLAVGGYLTNYCGRKKNSAILSFRSTSSVPQVMLGLNTLDIGNSSDYNLSINSYVDNMSVNKFTIHLDASGDSKLYNAGVSWLKLSANNPNLQCGMFNTTDFGATRESGNVYARIEFAHHFLKQPIVFAGLTGFGNIDNGKIELSTSNIDCHGFDIHNKSKGITKLWSTKATWIAFPSDRSDIFTGELRGEDIRGWHGSLYLASSFYRTPIIFTALTKFDFQRKRTCSIMVKTRATKTGLNWEIATWADTKLHLVPAAYLLIDM